MKANRKISIGFAGQDFESGAHVCQIFNDDEERHKLLVNYIVSGLNDQERVALFTENESENSLTQYFADHGIDYKLVEQSEDFRLAPTAEVYFHEDQFDMNRMLSLLRSFLEESIAKGKAGARVIGEMVPQVESIKGGESLLEYESRVTLLCRETLVTCVCQYDARQFDGATILDVLKVHPYMIVKGAVVNNPFYITPEEFLAEKQKSNERSQ